MTQALTVTLFEKLGGKPAITAVTNEFYKRVLADPDLKGYFSKTNMDKQIESQIDFLSMALGGPNNYKGKDMKSAHKGMGITEPHFGKVAGHLVDSLKWAKVPDEDIDAVIALVGPLKADIVTA